jgi:prepilin-type N-terminal cleavage/methylation domain-containing protein
MQRVRKIQKGFTLIEMAIVLVVIGLIVAAITVGKDTMRTAEYNKVYSKYISPWTQAAYSYYAKTGKVPTPTTNDDLVARMLSVGATLPPTYKYTDESGTEITVSITGIVDARVTAVSDANDTTGTAPRTGGMVATFSATEAVAETVDAILDSGVDTITGTSGLGATAGDVRWSVDTAYAKGGQGGATAGAGAATMSIRLREILGAGASSS